MNPSELNNGDQVKISAAFTVMKQGDDIILTCMVRDKPFSFVASKDFVLGSVEFVAPSEKELEPNEEVYWDEVNPDVMSSDGKPRYTRLTGYFVAKAQDGICLVSETKGTSKLVHVGILKRPNGIPVKV